MATRSPSPAASMLIERNQGPGSRPVFPGPRPDRHQPIHGCGERFPNSLRRKMIDDILVSRRQMLARCGAGFGMIGLAGALCGRCAGCRSAGGQDAAPSGEGEAHHPSLHERRAVAGRYLRSQAGPGANSRASARPASPVYRTENAHRRPASRRRSSSRARGQSGLPISEIYPQRRQVRATICASSARCTPTSPITSRRCS